MKKYLLIFLLSFIPLLLAMTVFAESIVIGPLLLTLFLFSFVYGLIGICKRHKVIKTVTRALLEFILYWP